jgi:UMF1 family MFS transporter
MGDQRPRINAQVLRWAMYDIASSNYHAIVPAFFGLYFLSLAGTGHAAAKAVWGAAVATSLLAAAVLAPLVGAWADRTGRWFGALLGLTVVCVLGTLLLPLTARAGVFVGCLLFVIAQTGYTVASSVYDSLVVDVAASSHRSRTSAIGWALGLLGGIVAIVVALLLLRGVPAAQQVQNLGSVFMAAAALFAALAVPGFAGLRGLRASAELSAGHAAGLGASLRAVGTTLRSWREHLQAVQVLLSFFLINDVLVTINFFVAIVLSARFGLAIEGLLWLSLLYHLIAIPSTVAFGTLADRLGPKPTVLAMCATLASAVLLLAFGRADWVPVAAVVLLGLVFSSIQAVFRSLYASVVPPEQVAELFGFNAVAGRLSAAIGPLIFGVAAAAFGNNTWALCLLLLPLGAGVWLLGMANLAEQCRTGTATARTVIRRSGPRRDAE